MLPSRPTTADETPKKKRVRSRTKVEARMSEGSGRQEMERRLIEKSVEDEAFRRRLIEDPKGAVEQELGTRLPEEVRVVTVEETQDTIYLVLPATPMAGAESVELSDRELESVSGAGTESGNWGCPSGDWTCGICK
jgi:hypothetical protein